jgi:hypothetical protein
MLLSLLAGASLVKEPELVEGEDCVCIPQALKRSLVPQQRSKVRVTASAVFVRLHRRIDTPVCR